jgi:hypothetical protein
LPLLARFSFGRRADRVDNLTMAHDWIDDGLRREREREADHGLACARRRQEAATLASNGPALMRAIRHAVEEIVDAYRQKTAADVRTIDYEPLPHEGFSVAKLRLPTVVFECRPDYAGRVLACSLTRTDDKDSDPTEWLFNLAFAVTDTGTVQLRHNGRPFEDAAAAAMCLLTPVLFPLLEDGPTPSLVEQALRAGRARASGDRASGR